MHQLDYHQRAHHQTTDYTTSHATLDDQNNPQTQHQQPRRRYNHDGIMARLHQTCHSNRRTPSPTTADRNVDYYLLYTKVAMDCTHRQSTNYALDTTYFRMAARVQSSTTHSTTSSETTQALVGRFPDIPSDDPHSTTFLARRCRQPHELGTIGTQVHHLYEHANTALTTTTTIGHARLSATATTTTISAGRDTRDILSYTSTRQTTTHSRVSAP